MKVVLFAYCPSAAVYVERLCAEAAAPRLVVTGSAAERGAVGIASRELGIAIEVAPDPNAPDLVARVASLGPDLLIVAGCPRILRREIRATARLGAVNFHPSLLPRYRAKEPIFWAILGGERRVGITVHHLTDDVDAGPILFQRALEVPPRATSASLARDVDRLGAELLPELLRASETSLPAGHPQAGTASRFPPVRPEHGLVDWSRSAVDIDRLVRACVGEIQAQTSFSGMKLVVLVAEPTAGHLVEARPGEILSISEEGPMIGTSDGALLLRRFLFMDRGYDAAALARELGIRVGDRLGAG